MSRAARTLAVSLWALSATAWAALPDDAPDARPDTSADRAALVTPEAEEAPPHLVPAASAQPGAGPVSFATRPVRTNYLIPALESEALHLGFLAFSNLATRQSFAQVSLDSIASHFDGRRPWTWDVDYFITNQFGHPYQGALAFTASSSTSALSIRRL